MSCSTARPVATGVQAMVKDIVIYASGGAAEIRRLRPLFADFSRAVHDLGGRPACEVARICGDLRADARKTRTRRCGAMS